MKLVILRDSSQKSISPSWMEGVHYGFIADDSLGLACQMIGEAVLEKNLKKAMLGLALVTAPGASDEK